MEKEAIGFSGFITFELQKSDGSITIMKKENKQQLIKMGDDE